ncbi:hypothetical protein [Prosthecodimorpha staleyi]|uniref:DUF1475 domain-containing protein n=1 Tax=Prosthecodimorpha staleyi TaxID=2840188 RepID=A0A947D6K6_9HYPH|nr:hypothetical protein [Prosthecodimorpha staleyi]MBT9292018.1 hypothetical protein [Prosthecodimorpha staleyi]
MPLPATLIRLAALAAAAVFAGVIVWASRRADLFASFATVAADPWGLVALIDLYLGFVVTTGLVAAFERRVGVVLAFVVALFVLGNLATLGWVAWRAPSIARRLAASAAPPTR